MDIVKVIGVGILGVVMSSVLKSAKSEISVFVIIGTSTIILLMIIGGLKNVITSFENLVDRSGISKNLFSGILKIIGIGYLTEFAGALCDDLDASSVSKKILLAGKISIFIMSVPIFESLFGVIEKLISL